MQAVLDNISRQTGLKITNLCPVSGGDISAAYKLDTHEGAFFLKVNAKPFAGEMFIAEKTGLQSIKDTQTIAAPDVLLTSAAGGKSFLLMRYVESKRATPNDYRIFGRQLAQMHRCTHETFGFPSDNFIGSLPQTNSQHAGWPEFYWEERISPQLKTAVDNRLLRRSEIPAKEKAIAVFNKISGETKPSLLHGDLWSGNYLIAADSTPFLIDPAVYYGHSMVDIAMSRLFGGFSRDFYDAYHEIIPKTEHYETQIQVYQLYYLLVHLNLFGSGYYSGVKSVIARYLS